MSSDTRRLRLDEILVRDGLISEEQIKQALERQREYGGRFGTQLLVQGIVTEAELVNALSQQFQSDGVTLSDKEVPGLLLQMIPRKIALSRQVFPFDYDPDENVLKVACQNPNDQKLLNELRFLAHGKNVRLYVTAEASLHWALAKFYLGQEISFARVCQGEMPDLSSPTDKIPIIDDDVADTESDFARCRILLVSDDLQALPLLRGIFEQDGFVVDIVDSADDAIELLSGRPCQAIFIKDTVPGDYIDLIDRARKISPKTLVRYFDSTSSLLLQSEAVQTAAELNRRNLDLFTTLLSLKAQQDSNHGGQVGHYVSRLCQKLGLPEKDSLIITNAAYVHNLARYYYADEDIEDDRRLVQLTARLLTSLNYSPTVVGILRSMYIDLKKKFTRRLPIEELGGNIITIVDLFCQHITKHERLSLDRFDSIKKNLRDQIGKLFMEEVVEGLINLVQEEILAKQKAPDKGQIMIFSGNHPLLQPLQVRLANEGFRTVSHNNQETFVKLYTRSKPAAMIICVRGEPKEITLMIAELMEQGINFSRTPTFLLTDRESLAHLTGLLEQGIEDIVALDDNLDLLITKITKFYSRQEQKARVEKRISSGAAGAQGRLSEMNLIDLLQALGPGLKTARVSVKPSGEDSTPLALWLDKGKIVHAEYGSIAGVQAIYEGIGWSDGSWQIETIKNDALPEATITQDNEAILMEGCRLLDERSRSPHIL